MKKIGPLLVAALLVISVGGSLLVGAAPSNNQLDMWSDADADPIDRYAQLASTEKEKDSKLESRRQSALDVAEDKLLDKGPHNTPKITTTNTPQNTIHGGATIMPVPSVQPVVTEASEKKDKTIARFNKYFSNQVVVVDAEQIGNTDRLIVVTTTAPQLKKNDIVLYFYDSDLNKYYIRENASLKMDDKGNITFSTAEAGLYVISDGPLTKK